MSTKRRGMHATRRAGAPMPMPPARKRMREVSIRCFRPTARIRIESQGFFTAFLSSNGYGYIWLRRVADGSSQSPGRCWSIATQGSIPCLLRPLKKLLDLLPLSAADRSCCCMPVWLYPAIDHHARRRRTQQLPFTPAGLCNSNSANFRLPG